MCTLIKPLFRLMVVTFIFALLMPVTTTRANPDCSEEKHAGNPNCPDPAPSITYTVGLMGSVFEFGPLEEFTPNEKENALFPVAGATLTFSRPDTTDAGDAWDAVFVSCENFFGPHPIIGPTPVKVYGFTVPAGNWRINRDGGVRLVMFDIPFDEFGNSPPVDSNPVRLTVTLQLIGHTFFDEKDASWLLPVPGDDDGYAMMDSWITGGTVKGVHPRKSCVSKGGTEIIMNFDLGAADHTLKIVAN